ncbi:MAG TPA: hypothetical protein VFZ38_10770 [Vicinamibacterales bacterium]
MAEVDICNMALDRIGVDQDIESLDDTSLRARVCKRWYAHCRDVLLSDTPWNWALRVTALAEVSGDVPPGWSKQYRYPTDCLALKDVTDAGGSRYPLNQWYGAVFYGISYPWSMPRYSWEVRGEAENETGKIILVDCAVPYGLYVRRVTDPNQFDVQFTNTLAWGLAVEIAAGVKASADMRKQAAAAYAECKASAVARFMREARPDREPDSVSIQARA